MRLICNRTQNDAIWELIALFLTNQIAGNTIDFKMNVINVETLNCIHVDVSVFAMRVSIFVTGDFMSTFKIQSSQLFAADDLFHFYVIF